MDEKKLDKIVELYNELAEQLEEHYMQSEENIYADYCSWGWTEAGLDVPTVCRNIDNEETIELIESLEEKFGMDFAIKTVMENSDLNCTNIYIQSNEIYSVSMGEVEEMPSDELEAEFNELTDEEKEYVRKNVSNCYVSNGGWLYLSLDFNRWVLILDTEEFNFKAEELLEESA